MAKYSSSNINSDDMAKYSSSNINSDDNLVEEEAFDLALMDVFGTESPDQSPIAVAAADRQIEHRPDFGILSVPFLINEEKYIFFYGGKDNEWIQKFKEKATALARDPFLKDLYINIQLFCVGKTARGEEHRVQKFWGGVEGFFSRKGKKQVNPVTKEIEKLLSYKDSSGWAVLGKDSTVVITGGGVTFLRVIEEFDQWKEALVKNNSFDRTFKEYYATTSLHVSTVAGK